MLGMGFESRLDVEFHIGVQFLKSLNPVDEGHVVFRNSWDGDGELWVIAEVGEEWTLLGRRMGSVIVRKLCNGQKGVPVSLLIVDVASQVLF